MASKFTVILNAYNNFNIVTSDNKNSTSFLSIECWVFTLVNLLVLHFSLLWSGSKSPFSS